MEQVKFAEDNLLKIWTDMVHHITSIFLKAPLHIFYLLYFWIPWLMQQDVDCGIILKVSEQLLQMKIAPRTITPRMIAPRTIASQTVVPEENCPRIIAPR